MSCATVGAVTLLAYVARHCHMWSQSLGRAALEPATLHADLAMVGSDGREGRRRTCCAHPAHAFAPALLLQPGPLAIVSCCRLAHSSIAFCTTTVVRAYPPAKRRLVTHRYGGG